jgi:hypothetical protein
MKVKVWRIFPENWDLRAYFIYFTYHNIISHLTL